jgi:hypothetical protein
MTAFSRFGGALGDSLKDVITFSPEQCAMISEWVVEASPHMQDRGLFRTLGAGAYIDKPEEYRELAKKSNAAIKEAGLMPHIEVAGRAIRSEMKPDATICYGNQEFDPEIGEQGLPGFHVIDDTGNGKSGMFHVDMPYQRFYWPSPFTAPFTFTTLVQEPACGSGLWHWDNMDYEEGLRIIHETRNPSRSSETPEKGRSLLRYELGHTYIHSGRVPHAIANTGDFAPGEYRITLQGHGAYLPECNSIVLYF